MSEVPLSVIAVVVLCGGLLPDYRPVRVGVGRVYVGGMSVGGMFGVQGGEDLVRRPEKAVAQEQRSREEGSQEHPAGPPAWNKPDGSHPSHLDRFVAFHCVPYIPLGGIQIMYSVCHSLSNV